MNKPSKVKVEGSVDDVIALAYGGKPQKLADGGMTEGPSHEQGGVEVQQDGEEVAEIEGGERVFSREDTAMMEEAAMQIIQLQQAGDQAGAEDMAKRLGFAIVNMIAAQEENQAAQEEQMAGRAGGMAPTNKDVESMNQFATEPDPYA